jgi:hypothetical protein
MATNDWRPSGPWAPAPESLDDDLHQGDDDAEADRSGFVSRDPRTEACYPHSLSYPDAVVVPDGHPEPGEDSPRSRWTDRHQRWSTRREAVIVHDGQCCDYDRGEGSQCPGR